MLSSRTGSNFLHYLFGNSAAFHLVGRHFEKDSKPSYLVRRRNPLPKLCFTQVRLIHLDGGRNLTKSQVPLMAEMAQPSTQPQRMRLAIKRVRLGLASHFMAICRELRIEVKLGLKNASSAKTTVLKDPAFRRRKECGCGSWRKSVSSAPGDGAGFGEKMAQWVATKKGRTDTSRGSRPLSRFLESSKRHRVPPVQSARAGQGCLGMDFGLRGLQSAPSSSPGEHQNAKNHPGLGVTGGKRPQPMVLPGKNPTTAAFAVRFSVRQAASKTQAGYQPPNWPDSNFVLESLFRLREGLLSATGRGSAW